MDPKLPIEFARVSSRNRLTLVLSDNVPFQQTLWTLSRKATLAEAITNLADREGTIEANIGCWPWPAQVDGLKKLVVSIVADWARERRVDGVVWTALSPKKPSGETGVATEDETIGYLRRLVKRGEAALAKEYVEKAPTQIRTPLRSRIREELGWT